MKFVTDDNMEFDSFEEAQQYEQTLAKARNAEKCSNQIKEGISKGTMYVANIKESDGIVKSTVIIHNPEGVEDGLKEAIIMSAFGEPVVFDAKSFTYNPVYTVDAVKPKHLKIIEQVASDLTSSIETFRVTSSYVVVNDVIIFAKDLDKVVAMLEANLFTESSSCESSYCESSNRPYYDILSILFGI